VGVGKMEGIEPTTSLLIPATVINHNSDPPVGNDINLEDFEESDKVEIDD